MKKLLLIMLIMLLWLTSCNKNNEICSKDKILTDLTYVGYSNIDCMTKEAYLDIIKVKCKDRVWDFLKCQKDFLDIKNITLQNLNN